MEGEVDAVNQDDARNDDEVEFELAWVANTVVEAQLAQAALDEAGIRYLVEDFLANPYDGALATQSGWGRILVPESDVARAREILAEALEPSPIGEDAEAVGEE